MVFELKEPMISNFRIDTGGTSPNLIFFYFSKTSVASILYHIPSEIMSPTYLISE